MEITFDAGKRQRTLKERGLDFSDAAKVFAGRHAVIVDQRRDYGEPRFISAGLLDGRMVVIAWTPRGKARRIISMRYCHEDEADDWRAVINTP